MSNELEPTRISSPAARDAYPEEKWQPCDLVLAANGYLWVRASNNDIAKGWAWGYSHETVGPSDGSVEEEYPVRPLTLLVRDGKPVRTIVYRPGTDAPEIEVAAEPLPHDRMEP